ncbi:hypothetical protein RRG08_015122 [Elysia crispata]|uniref:Uncharacterized protein n=1 Tax=Elysia crispata TaxID=231223 RepID=A0AAE0Z734_9GAST|nr:hypothetical protein RRG08_015122 [Elysia crispata]
MSNNTVQARPTTDMNTESSVIHEVSQRLDTCLLVSPGTRSAADFIRSSPAVSIKSGRSEGNTSRRSGVSGSGSDAQLSFIASLRNRYQEGQEQNDGKRPIPSV